jgi:hypothetical protein
VSKRHALNRNGGEGDGHNISYILSIGTSEGEGCGQSCARRSRPRDNVKLNYNLTRKAISALTVFFAGRCMLF